MFEAVTLNQAVKSKNKNKGKVDRINGVHNIKAFNFSNINPNSTNIQVIALKIYSEEIDLTHF